MSTPLVLLGLLTEQPRHGYDLKHAHDARFPKAKPLAFGQVYATLGRLERDGFAVAKGSDQRGGPERTVYAATADGRSKLDHWLSDVEIPAPHVTSALLAKVTVALLVADVDTAATYITDQVEAHMSRMRELTAVKTDRASTISDVIAADYAINHLDADLRWLRTTLDRVSDLHQEVHS
jgi:DNA-binding PadR family transcriptional regulator